MKTIEGCITAPKGFKATGNFIGLKKAKKDLACIASTKPAAAAGVFTTNLVKAAPVLWDMEVLKRGAQGGTVSGIVINSGNANACTGEKGMADAKQMAALYAGLLGVSAEEVFVCSTGVIGVNLPMQVIEKGIPDTFKQLGESAQDGQLAAEAIMTTDTFSKSIAVEIEIGGKTVRIGGIAKGSGMIHPNMATLLGVITTDASITHEMLQKALTESCQDSYNMISVDGDVSTNDTMLALANGLAENETITEEGSGYQTFKEALHFVNRKLAIDIAKDGEGATKLVEVTVSGARTKEDARAIARSVVSSSLFKSALFGADANWGRVLCAMGYSGGFFNQADVQIVFRSSAGSITLMERGNPIVFDEKSAKSILSEAAIFVDITLKDGDSSATAWGCDLTYDYVKINGDYRS